ncbi:MAG: hypothetical protein KME30_15000 [Iphinoe sp. HA4291-MV1]|jgi:hypothetical protein|nr:hypothetical protein [Iphinoe sp. HA4291-MV1]
MTTKGKLEPPPQALLEPLLELRDYYAALTEEYERLWQTARSQLVHVEALLSNWSAVDERDNLTAVVETLSFAPTPPQQDSLSPQQPDKISNVEQQEAIESEFQDDEEQEIDLDDVEQQEAIESELQDDEEQEIDLDDVEQQEAIESELQDDEEQEIDLDEESSDAENTVVTAPTPSPQEETSTQNNDYSFPGTDIPMLPKYHILTRMQAIAKILRDNVGTVCHIDFIVRSLFGDLEPSVFKIVKSRIQSSLTHGKEKSYWAAVPGEPGCYTLDLNLVTPLNGNGNVKSKTIKPKRKKPFLLPKAKRVPMLPEYEGKFLIDAICILLQRNSGKIFSVADVITGLYGELNAEQLREIKTAVHNELSRGHRIGRFSRVPEKVGYYSWNLNKIQTK